MVAYPDRLPNRFPEGTKYIVEGCRGGGFSRYVVFPDGTRLRLPARRVKTAIAGKNGRRARASALR
ncbi:MAG TPA: hypothetical protein VNQ56_05345 [Pseudolabrys sp.]|nr:hypothetical protein [Pseudolabrys sp.]